MINQVKKNKKYSQMTQVIQSSPDCVGYWNQILELQMDLNNICKWSQEWLMLFNVVKSKVMYMARSKIINAKY